MGRKPAPKIHMSNAAIKQHVGYAPKDCEFVSEQEIGHAYNTMNYHYGFEDAHNFILNYAKENDEDLYRVVSKTRSNQVSTTFGWICYFKMNNVSIPISSEEWFSRKRNEMIKEEIIDNIIDFVPNQSKSTKSFEDTMIYDELERVIDGYHLHWNKFKSFDFAKYFNEKDVKLFIQKDYLAKAKDTLFELENPENDDQLEEAYRHYSAKKKSAMIDFYSNLIEVIETNLNIRRQNRKPRKVKKDKTKIIKKMVSMLRVQQNSSELGIKSVDIERVIDSEFAVFYDTKYKKLTVLVSEQGKKLAGHRTAIVNFDTKKSFSIVLRKPKEILTEVISSNRARILKIVDGLTTKKTEIDSFMTSEFRMLIKVG